ncbi:MAG: ribosome maturation factor RimP [Lachnospiraceae bacterium]|nr:ribosome maturation factor RimP [Lachnospiraceae bacterium]
MSKKSDYEKKTTEFILPILEEMGFSLYDVEYVKEAGEYFLRTYIDKPEGITIDDCVDVSRRMNEILDREDYIADSYTFEVSSPGVERVLRKEQHFLDAIGEEIHVGLYAPKNGSKDLWGRLKSYSNGDILLDCDGQEVSISKNQIAACRLAFH